ncbi:MAG: hypothetical protein BroJett011_08370 [Chloroflexota bacterium]|nr:MAG: hypothetical protein BroJett011_08370 [Chloroflexota bacterium]
MTRPKSITTSPLILASNGRYKKNISPTGLAAPLQPMIKTVAKPSINRTAWVNVVKRCDGAVVALEVVAPMALLVISVRLTAAAAFR